MALRAAPLPCVPAFDAQAERYDARWRSYLESTHALALGLLFPAAGDVVLDASGGTGLLAKDIADIVGPSGKVVVADASRGMLEVASRRLRAYPNVALVRQDVNSLDCGEGYFSRIVCTSAFHYYARPARALFAFYEALKPGGCLVIVDWCRDPWHFNVFDKVMRLMDPSHVRAYSSSEMNALVEQEGFRVTALVKQRHDWWSLMGLRAEKSGGCRTSV